MCKTTMSAQIYSRIVRSSVEKTFFHLVQYVSILVTALNSIWLEKNLQCHTYIKTSMHTLFYTHNSVCTFILYIPDIAGYNSSACYSFNTKAASAKQRFYCRFILRKLFCFSYLFYIFILHHQNHLQNKPTILSA